MYFTRHVLKKPNHNTDKPVICPYEIILEIIRKDTEFRIRSINFTLETHTAEEQTDSNRKGRKHTS